MADAPIVSDRRSVDSPVPTPNYYRTPDQSTLVEKSDQNSSVDEDKKRLEEDQEFGLGSRAPEADEKQIETAKATEEAPSPRNAHGVKWTIIVIAILSSIFLFSLDNTIVADVQPAIVAEFGHIDKLPWLSVAFTLSAASTTLLWGKLYGQFNTKWLYCLNVLIFEVGSAVCGGSTDIDMLIVGRAICGIGGIGMYIGVSTYFERPNLYG